MQETGKAKQQNNQSAEQELTSKTLMIQNKRFYLDVKQNLRGKFIKIAEVGIGGRKSRILMSLSTAAEFRDKLNELSNCYNGLAPHNAENLAADGRLQSDTIVKDTRRYYLDLKENARGRFLRVTMVAPSNRSQIAIPAQGIIELRNALTELIKEYGGDENGSEDIELPEPKSFRIDNKMFYFDVGCNRRGVFLRVSEVRTNYRTAITIPEKSWASFKEIINEMSAQMSSKANGSLKTEPGNTAQGDGN